MTVELLHAQLTGSDVGFDLQTNQLTIRFDMAVNGETRPGRPWRVSPEGAEQLIYQLRHALDLLRQTGNN